MQLNPDLWIKEDPFQIIDTYMSSSKSRKMLEKWTNPQVFENAGLVLQRSGFGFRSPDPDLAVEMNCNPHTHERRAVNEIAHAVSSISNRKNLMYEFRTDLNGNSFGKEIEGKPDTEEVFNAASFIVKANYSLNNSLPFNIHSSAFFDKCQNKMKNAIKRDWNALCDASYPYADPLSPGIRYAVNNAMREDAYKNINRYFNRVMVNQNRDAQKKFLQENDAFKIMESYTYNSDSMIHLNMWTDIEAFENAGNILNSANISFLQPERSVDELFEIQKNSDPEKNKQNIAKIRDNIIERVLGMADSKCIPYLDAVLAERAEEDFYPSIKNEPSFFKNCCAIMEGKESKMHKDPDRILNRLLRSMQKTSKNSKQIDNDLGI